MRVIPRFALGASCGVRNGRGFVSGLGKAVKVTGTTAGPRADRPSGAPSAKTRASDVGSVKGKPVVKAQQPSVSQQLAKPQPAAKTPPAGPATGRDDDPFIAVARRKVDAMSAEIAAQEKKHKKALARVERERQDLERKIEDLERRIEELTNVERRFQTLQRHLDGSLTWRLGSGLRSTLRAWRKLVRPGGKGT